MDPEASKVKGWMLQMCQVCGTVAWKRRYVCGVEFLMETVDFLSVWGGGRERENMGCKIIDGKKGQREEGHLILKEFPLFTQRKEKHKRS